MIGEYFNLINLSKLLVNQGLEQNSSEISYEIKIKHNSRKLSIINILNQKIIIMVELYGRI